MSSSDHPHVENGIVHMCGDGRFNGFVAHRLEAHGPVFVSTMAGGALAFLVEEDADAALRQIAIYHSVHPAETLWLYSHMDCGYYKAFWLGRGSNPQEFTSLEHEVGTKWEHLRQAQAIIEVAISSINVVPGLADHDGSLIPEPA